MISVIISTYGEHSWSQLARERALPSVIDQTSDIVIGHHKDATIAQVRNALARKAARPWLCFLDADDELAPGYIAAMEKAIARTKVSRERHYLYTPMVQQIEDGVRKKPAFYAEVNLLRANWLIVATVVERELFERVGGFSDYPHGFEDWSLWYKCARLGARVNRVAGALYIQYVDPESKHRQGWRNRPWQVRTHQRVQRELKAWQP